MSEDLRLLNNIPVKQRGDLKKIIEDKYAQKGQLIIKKRLEALEKYDQKKDDIKSKMEKHTGKEFFLVRDVYLAIPYGLSNPVGRKATVQAIQRNKYINLNF